MAKEESYEIEILVPGIDHIPGWTSMSPAKREWLQKQDTTTFRFRRMQAAGAIGEARSLYLTQRGLEGEKMTMGSYIASRYPKSDRTAWRRLADYQQLTKLMPEAAIDALAHDESGILQGTGDVIRAAKMLPAPKSKEPKVIDAYVGDLKEKLREERRSRRKGKKGLDPDDAMKMFVTFTKRLLRESKLNQSAEQRTWLKKAVGYLMESRAITGTVATERISIPDGWMPQVGRPRKKVA